MREVSATRRESPFGFAVNPTARARNLAQMAPGEIPTRQMSACTVRHRQNRAPELVVRNAIRLARKGTEN